MNHTDRPDPVILGHLLGEHRELHSAIAAVRCLLSKRSADGESGADEVVAALNALRAHLHDHFEKEERGGFLEESVTRIPRLAKAVAAVLADHPRLLAEIDGLIDSLPTGGVSAEAWRSCSAGFDRFAGHLVAHERRENAVVQEGYNEDLGLID